MAMKNTVWHTLPVLNKNYTLPVLLFHNFHNTINFPLPVTPQQCKCLITIGYLLIFYRGNFFMACWKMEEWAHDGIRWPQVSRNGLTMEEWRNGQYFHGLEWRNGQYFHGSQWRNGRMGNIFICCLMHRLILIMVLYSIHLTKRTQHPLYIVLYKHPFDQKLTYIIPYP